MQTFEQLRAEASLYQSELAAASLLRDAVAGVRDHEARVIRLRRAARNGNVVARRVRRDRLHLSHPLAAVEAELARIRDALSDVRILIAERAEPCEGYRAWLPSEEP